jgi:hypothetical protein
MSNFKFIFIISGAVLFLNIAITHAASLSLQTPSQTAQLNTPFAVDVILDPQGQVINATQGVLAFSTDTLMIKGIYTGNSIINLWIQKPQEASSGTIAWGGIIPGGFDGILEPNQTSTLPGKLFTVVFDPVKTGTVDIDFQTSTVLLNNGRGTPANLTTDGIVLTVTSSTNSISPLPTTITNDHNPPDPFTITLTRDPGFFHNQWFIIFNAQDKESGVASYGILESIYPRKNINDSEWRPVSSPYVLHDQSLSSYVYVRAVDYAGNARIAVLTPAHPVSAFTRLAYVWVIILMLGIVITLWFIKKHKVE